MLREAGIEPAKIKLNENANDSNSNGNNDSSRPASGERLRQITNDRLSPAVATYTLPGSGRAPEPVSALANKLWCRELAQLAQTGTDFNSLPAWHKEALSKSLHDPDVKNAAKILAESVKAVSHVPNGTSVSPQPMTQPSLEREGRGR